MKSLADEWLALPVAEQAELQIKALKSVNIGSFPDTERGREALQIHQNQLRIALARLQQVAWRKDVQ